MKFGAQVMVYFNDWDDIRRVVEVVEAGPWSSIWYADHYLPPSGRKDDESMTAHEAFTLAAATAGMTQRVRIGHLVLGNTYRNPALVAKMAATLDHISRGRFVLGIGAGWFQREHEAYGWDFPAMRERQDRLEEAVELIRALFRSEEPITYRGRHYSLENAPLSPGCYQRPHIPILVGGTGEKRTLRTLARHGDVMNLDGWAGGPMTAEYFRHKIAVLDRHCEEAGRDPAELSHTVLMPMLVTENTSAAEKFVALRRLGEGSAVGPKSFVIDRIGEIIEAGAHEIMIGGLPTRNLDQFHLVAEEVIPAFD